MLIEVAANVNFPPACKGWLPVDIKAGCCQSINAKIAGVRKKDLSRSDGMTGKAEIKVFPVSAYGTV